jgi:signal transduction histidine kinase/ActR/RegA family two-component response regulator
MPASPQVIKQHEQDLEQRLGLLPSIFRATPESYSAVSALWSQARVAWLDNPLPGAFRERLLVYLALQGGSRYCLLRHAAWARGGRLLEPATTTGSSGLLQLLQLPAPTEEEIRRACELLDGTARGEMPAAGSALEQGLFVAAGALFLGRGEVVALRRALGQALGPVRLEQLLLLVAYFQNECKWVQMHPDLPLDDDAASMIKREPDFAQLVDAALAHVDNRERQRDRFMGMLGHELRNPVAAISAVSDMFQVVGVEDERLRNASNILHRQTRALSEMLDNLLELSNLTSGKLSMAKAPVVPDEVLGAALRQQEAAFAQQGITVRHVPAERRAYVMADRARLTQVFEQILANARKLARSPGSLQIGTQVEDKTLAIRFRDDGGGLAGDKSRSIFDPYTTYAPGRQDGGGGSGIGLTIARMIVMLHDGSLEAASSGPGRGSTFTLRLPLATQEASSKAEKKNLGRPASRMRVLAIEDNKDFAQLFRHMLEIMGCELDITADARSGLKLAHERLPELIFCDIGLPGDMNGFDFARAVRADARLAHIPLVAVSGYSSPEDREKAMAAGFDRVCAKPVKFADISEALAVYSANRPAES